MNQYEVKRIFQRSLPELSEPLKSAVEFALANWDNWNGKPNESEITLTFLAELPALPMDARVADKTLIDKLNESVSVLRDNPDIWQNLADLPHEEWRDIIDYEGRYQVSNFGRVKSFYFKRQTILRANVFKKIYPSVSLNKNGKAKSHSIHVLVALAFIPNPENKPYVNHEDNDHKNNCIWNLNWATPKENNNHAISLGVYKFGSESPKALLTPEQVLEIRRLYVKSSRQFGLPALAKQFNVAKTTIHRIVKGKGYSDVE